MSIPRLLRPLRRVHEHIILLTAFALLGVGCLLWSALAFPLNLILPRRRGVWLGRWMATLGFRVYLLALRVIGLARFDLRALDALRDAGPMIIAPNHPGLLDAPMILSRLPNIVCVIKGSLLANPLWGAGSRLARYIPNDWFIGSVNLAVEDLQTGSQLLMFPEGTRTGSMPISALSLGPAYISKRAKVPIQTVIIEQDTPFLGKGVSLLKHTAMPVRFRIRLGRRFDAPADPRAFTTVLHAYFLSELGSPPSQT